MGKSIIALIAGMLLYTQSAAAQQSQCATVTEQTYVGCTQGCKQTFYFSENSEAPFALPRIACLRGCECVSAERLPKYQSCLRSCKKDFRYRHGIKREFAEFQAACVAGCRNVR